MRLIEIESFKLPRCFDIDAMIIQSMIIDHVMWIIVEKMAFVVNEMRDLLKIRATTSNKHEIQPEAREKKSKQYCCWKIAKI